MVQRVVASDFIENPRETAVFRIGPLPARGKTAVKKDILIIPANGIRTLLPAGASGPRSSGKKKAGAKADEAVEHIAN